MATLISIAIITDDNDGKKLKIQAFRIKGVGWFFDPPLEECEETKREMKELVKTLSAITAERVIKTEKSTWKQLALPL